MAFFQSLTVAASLSFPIIKDNGQLKISLVQTEGHVQRGMLWNDFNPENTVILEGIPHCSPSELESYIESEIHHEQIHLIQTVGSPSTALLTSLQGK